MSEPVLTEDQRDALQEVANLAMGQAATRLARLLDAFIELSVPRVKVVAVSEAAAALREMTGIEDTVSAVRQGFRSDIKGEALVICRSDSIEQLCSLVSDPYSRSSYETVSQKELVFDRATGFSIGEQDRHRRPRSLCVPHAHEGRYFRRQGGCVLTRLMDQRVTLEQGARLEISPRRGRGEAVALDSETENGNAGRLHRDP